ncbi:hypothetical protein QJR30_09010 [Paraclostridium sordellii]|uniref:hypothetical protein n=1 Tax=Paraclostridium sordellii TaxID=1505 RepID=UPI0005E1240B|nr:hypothetical protein [Paeniclostridium sordellii]CEP80614.1 radical SAM domain-containing protein [[Clostridium] sordellii] [Paeniclostridium sordellii]
MLRLSKMPGCVYFFVGLESFSKETLQTVNKGLNDVDKYKELIDSVHKYGICIQAWIIFGFDTDTKD